jgi:sugar-phosphatase
MRIHTVTSSVKIHWSLSSSSKVVLQCEAVLFDMDGTIVDSSIPVRKLWESWAGRFGIPYEKVEAVMHGRRAIETMNLVAPELPQPETVEQFLRDEALLDEGIVEIPGAAALLHALPANRWAVVTSATCELAKSRMKAAGLPIPEVLIGADLVTNGKPHPEGFLLAAEKLGVEPSKCLVVEDSIAGIAAGRAAGMQVLGVTTHYDAAALGTEAHVPNFTPPFHAEVASAGTVLIYSH